VSLASGTRLGPYEIVGPLGAGGMGEVYRARDTRLDRSVAVKVLPQSGALRDDLRTRFEREARAISALNHPNICTLYDVGSDNGVEYLVMELLEGETLAAQLGRGPLPIDRVLRYGAEVAGALDRAHKAGIVHRDLKPANIIVTKGSVKLLDFGVARLQSPPTAGPDATTMLNPITTEGMIVGTLQYMAPEQLEGQAADGRSDVFALGCILYEMTTGRRAFDGGSQASIITSIMSAEPPAMSMLVPITPPVLERLVRKCLAKSPDDRWQNAGDLATELRWLAEEPLAAAATTDTTKSRSLLPWAVAALSLLALVAVTAFLLRRPQTPAGPLRATIPIGGDAVQITMMQNNISVAPDGRSVIYGALTDGKGALWLRRFADAAGTRIPNTEGAHIAFWSPDSQQIAFDSGARLLRMPIAGGDPIPICDLIPGAFLSGAWGPDNTILLSQLSGNDDHKSDELWRVPSSGGTPEQVALVGQNARQRVIFPYFLDADRIVYCVFYEGGDFRLHLHSLRSGDDRDLGPVDSRVEVVGDAILFVRGGLLCGQRLGKDLDRIGEPVVLAPDIAFYGTLGGAEFSASADTLVYAAASNGGVLTMVDRSGKVLSTLGPPNQVRRFAVSHDGKRIVLERRDPRTGTSDLWLVDVARNTSTRITQTNLSEGTPRWSPDDHSIAFDFEAGGPPHLFTMPAGGGEATMITPVRGVQYCFDWTPDGRSLVFTELAPRTKRDIWLVAPKPGSQPVPWLITPFTESSPHVSPDGKWMAFVSDNSGKMQVYVAPFDQPGERVQVSVDGNAAETAWSRDGRELYWLTTDSSIYAAAIRTTPAFDAAAPQLLFHDSGAVSRELDTMPGSGNFVLSREVNGLEAREVNVIRNWRALLSEKN
jgi:Tol biopolymer transport system component